mgnify:CR=1 FL=1
MAFTYELTETIDPSALRDIVNNTGADIGPSLLVTGSYDAASLPAAVSDPVIAVTRDTAKGTGTNLHGRAAIRGLLQVTAGSGGFTKGQRLMPEANTGKAIPWTVAGGSNATIIGIAQQTVAANAVGLVEFNATGQFGQG